MRQVLALTLALLTVPAGAHGQDIGDLDEAVGFFFTVGLPQSSRISWPSLDEFFLLYGGDVAEFAPTRTITNIDDDGSEVSFIATADPATLLQPLTVESNLAFGVGFAFGPYDMELDFRSSESASSAMLRGGFQRFYESDLQLWKFTFGITAPGGAAGLGAFIGGQATRGRLSSYALYPDGTRSFGGESRYNGVWRISDFDWLIGAKFAFPISFVRLFARVEWINPFDIASRFDSGSIESGGIEQEDWGNFIQIGSDTYTFVQELPLDFDRWESPYLGRRVKGLVEGVQFQLGMAVFLSLR
ncbi:MAG: hypothetical protein AAGJ10_13245 [Bacteroidota bacterium]